jgi:CheY-like chemotaxis protein
MATSYHTNVDDPDDLRAGALSDSQPFREPRAEAPPPRLPITRPLYLSQTGMMQQVTLEEEAPLIDCDLKGTTAEVSALPRQEFADMSPENPVLIVEDTVELAEVIEATVEGMGLPAVVANHGSIALDQLQKLSPRLMLLDLGLPDINGWEIVKTVRELCKAEGRPMPPIIVITAYGDPANRLIGKFEEVNAYLVKPFTPEQIEQTIHSVLNAQT